MKLKSARVTNYRSVEDSGELTLEQVTCLVGKNEAGKTAICMALTGFNPHPSTPIEYEIERDYPRRHLNDYAERHGDENAKVVSTTWELENAEIRSIEAKLCTGALENVFVTGVRSYENGKIAWSANIDYQKVAQHFVDEANLNAAERSQIGSPTTTDELRKTVENIADRTEKQQALLERINALPGKNAVGAVTNVLDDCCPKFMYFSHYDRMAGQIRIDNFNERKARQQAPAIERGEEIFLDFLSYSGTSIEEIKKADTYETLNARCESASIKITDQLREYWTQNPNLEIEVRVTKAEPSDPPPFNAGIVARARVKNNLHRMTVPFSERSAGFIWFFSFLVKFAEVKKSGDNVFMVLDEPGLTLHGKAQADLLRYFAEKLAPHHQIVFSTHSPFMVPADNLSSVRIVEDRLYQPRPNQWASDGTKIRHDVLAVDRDTLFPLQGALGYDLTQTLFVGKHTVLLEGTSDIVYLQVLSDALGRLGRTKLDARWTLCPAGGIDKIGSFVGLFGGQDLHIVALTDFAKTDKKKLDGIAASKVLEDGHLLTFATLLELEEADVEDVFDPRLFADLLNGTFELPDTRKLDGAKLFAADTNTTRLVKKAEAAMRLMPPEIPEFDHFAPAGWLLRNPKLVSGKQAGLAETLDRAEKVITALNALMPS